MALDVASIYLFPNQSFFNRSIDMKGHVSDGVAVTQSSNAPGKTKKKLGAPTKSKSSATRATSESTNSPLCFFIYQVFSFSPPHIIFSLPVVNFSLHPLPIFFTYPILPRSERVLHFAVTYTLLAV